MSNNVLGVVALLTSLCFLALITLQALEVLYYRAAPSVWPLVQ